MTAALFQSPQALLFPRNIAPPESVWVTAYGMGTDSTGMLCEAVARGWPPPLAILAADTGGERQRTYDYRDLFSEWLVAQGYPAITTVRVETTTLEQDCLDRKTLPAIAFGGFKTCSIRFKQEPQNKWLNNNGVCKAEWAAGRKVTKAIGYEAGEEYRNKSGNEKYINRYPLQEWNMDREACRQRILFCGLPLPGKSACFFCSNTTPDELRQMMVEYPDLVQRAIHMEENADLTTIRGLWRTVSWKEVIEKGAQAPAYDRSMPCDCYDGDDA